MSKSLQASIIINNYNYGRFVGEAIESALRQTYENTEVIVVDDGSTDDSRDVIRGFGSKVKPIFKENGGQGSAFNAGFKISAGDFACFLDADDKLTATAMEESAKSFSDTEAVLVEWRLHVIDEAGLRKGRVIPERPLPCENLRELTIRNGPFYDWLITPPSSGNCYRRRFLEQVFPVPEQPYRHGADVYLTILAPIYGRVHRVAEPQAEYRQHGRNNYYGRSLGEDRLRDYLQRFEDCCVQLAKHLERQGVEPDVQAWRARNYNFLWPQRLLEAKKDLEKLLPPGAGYALINNGEWEGEDLIVSRHAVHFLERDGEYWGEPVDDDQAIQELDRLRQAGTTFLVIWWTAFWWLDVFPIFTEKLLSQARRVLDNDRVIVFELLPQHIHA